MIAAFCNTSNNKTAQERCHNDVGTFYTNV